MIFAGKRVTKGTGEICLFFGVVAGKVKNSVWEWTREAEIVATSRVAFPEAMSALARRFREGDIDPEGLNQVSEALKAQWHHLAVIGIDELAAGELAVKHCLRAFDAIHLDAAIAVRNTNSRARVTFSSFDTRLNGAAENEGFEVFSCQPSTGDRE